MKPHRAAACLLTLCAATAWAQPVAPAASESRDASLAYIGSANFMVGRLGRDCLGLLGRAEPPQRWMQAWRDRNWRYVDAAAKYLEARLQEAQDSGGKEKRDAVLQEVTAAVRSSGEKAVASWLGQGDRLETCRRAVSLVEAGGLDIDKRTPMFAELEALVAWAER